MNIAMASCVISAISAISAVIGIIHTLNTLKNENRNEVERRVTERVETNFKLDEISKSVNDIKGTMNETKQEVRSLAEKLTLVDAKADKAHMRLDLLEQEKGN